MNDNIGTIFDGLDEVATSTKGVVDLPLLICRQPRQGVTYDEGHASFMGDLCNCLDIWNVVSGISNALDVNGLGLGVDCLLQVLGPVALDELGVDSKARHEDLELVVASTVQIARADDVVSCVSQRSEGHELSGLCRQMDQREDGGPHLAGRGGNGGNTAFQSGNPLFKDIDSRLAPS